MEMPGKVIMIAPPESKGRLAKLWVQDILPCGVTMLSVYMWHSEGTRIETSV